GGEGWGGGGGAGAGRGRGAASPRSPAANRPASSTHERSREAARSKRRREEPGVVVGPSPHVLERESRTRLAPVADVHLAPRGQPAGDLEAGGPRHGNVRPADLNHRARVVRHTLVALPLVTARDAHGKPRPAFGRRGCVRGARGRESAVAQPPA